MKPTSTAPSHPTLAPLNWMPEGSSPGCPILAPPSWIPEEPRIPEGSSLGYPILAPPSWIPEEPRIPEGSSLGCPILAPPSWTPAKMARPQGLEPQVPGPEPGVLPLHHGRTASQQLQNTGMCGADPLFTSRKDYARQDSCGFVPLMGAPSAFIARLNCLR